MYGSEFQCIEDGRLEVKGQIEPVRGRDWVSFQIKSYAIVWIQEGFTWRWRRNRTGDHFLFYKFIERTTERWTKFTKQLLIASSGHQAPRKAAHCLRWEVGQGYWRSKRETRERGTESRPGKGVLLEEVSNHQETLALAGPGKALKSRRAT